MRAIILSAVALLVALPASADPVHILAGQNEGQGWAFTGPDGCWAVTARHVVASGTTGVIVSGANGRAAQATKVIFPTDTQLDVALLLLAGDLATHCPAAGLGDADETSVLSEILKQGGQLLLVKRLALATDGKGGGEEMLPLEIVGLDGAKPQITVRPPRNDDTIVETDSGSPVIYQGTGLLEKGIPIGIIVGTGKYSTVVRMDAVRKVWEAHKPSPATTLHSMKFKLSSFTGDMDDGNCGPLNLFATGPKCGWKVHKGADNKPISLSVAFPSGSEPISAVTLDFAISSKVSGIAVATSNDDSPDHDWIGEHYCPIEPSAHLVTCSLGDRTAKEVRVIFDGPSLELLSFQTLN